MKIAIDCDDGAINLRNVIFNHLKSKGIVSEFHGGDFTAKVKQMRELEYKSFHPN